MSEDTTNTHANNNNIRRYITLSVLMERSPVDHPWKDYAWHCVGVVTASGEENNEVTLISTKDQILLYRAGIVALRLHRGETEGYKRNLSQTTPSLFVVMCEGDENDELEIMPYAITVCPYEAESYAEDGEGSVENIPMPDDILNWVGSFVERYHQDEVFIKRKRGPKKTDGSQWRSRL